MKNVLTYGEILIRQQSASNYFFDGQQNLVEIFPGGSEANVAVSLAQFGVPTRMISAVPDNRLAKDVLRAIEERGVDISKVITYGDRIGTYILLSADGLTKGDVIYDRKFSSFSRLKIDQINFDAMFENIEWLHWTALTPALNRNMAKVMLSVLEEAHKRKINISVDLNYRSKLWNYGVEPKEVMPPLLQYCNVIMGNIWAANKFLSTSLDPELSRATSKETYFEQSKLIAREIFEAVPLCEHVANTFRFMDHPKHNLLYGTYHTREEDTISASLETQDLIDRIGSGDAFMAGLIYAILKNSSAQEIIEIATAAGFEKLFVKGDFGNGKY